MQLRVRFSCKIEQIGANAIVLDCDVTPLPVLLAPDAGKMLASVGIAPDMSDLLVEQFYNNVQRQQVASLMQISYHDEYKNC
jgi:hypothetical protein